MPTPSIARELFDQIVNSPDPIAAIRKLKNSNPPKLEGDHFDCQREDRNLGRRDSTYLKEWSKALGGFANAGGGVLIWGLVAKPTEVDGWNVDAVSDEEPIDEPIAVASRLKELQRGATDPPLGNVEIRPYTLADDPKKGFLVCFIPDGPFKPYRSENAGANYYMRAGDSTKIMPTAVLRAMFYSKTQAVFHPKVELMIKKTPIPERRDSSGMFQDANLDMRADFTLTNTGSATGREVLLCVSMNGVWSEQRPRPYIGHYKEWVAPNITVVKLPEPVHQRLPLKICYFEWRMEMSTGAKFSTGKCGDLSIGLEIFCEDQMPQKFSISMSAEDQIKIYNGQKLTLEGVHTTEE